MKFAVIIASIVLTMAVKGFPRPENGGSSAVTSLDAVRPSLVKESGQKKGIDSNIHGSTKVVGGRTAFKNEIPYIVYIHREWQSPQCGGAIYSNKYILTAAHCFYNIPTDAKLIVTAGSLDWSKSEGDEQRIYVQRYTLHPEYCTADYRNDIAIIELSTELTFNAGVQPIPIPPPNFDNFGASVSRQATASGWGGTAMRRYDDAYVPTSTTLQTIQVLLYPRAECDEIYRNAPASELYTNGTARANGIRLPAYTTLCAGVYPLDGGGICQGDSGGPLACARKEPGGVIKYLCGITSAGAGCGLAVPDAFTDVAKYTTWIKNVTQTV